ncbi:MAG: ferritin [Mangrovibacterium sp.]
MLTGKMLNALNEQINAELHSAYLYLSMSTWLEEQGLSGFANWMRVQYEEETAHAMKILHYTQERGGRVLLTPIAAVDQNFDSLLAVFEKTLAHEQHVTSLINNLVDIAIEERDHATRSFLQWFVDEQVEEEATAGDILNDLRLLNGESHGVFTLNREFASRKSTPDEE